MNPLTNIYFFEIKNNNNHIECRCKKVEQNIDEQNAAITV